MQFTYLMNKLIIKHQIQHDFGSDNISDTRKLKIREREIIYRDHEITRTF